MSLADASVYIGLKSQLVIWNSHTSLSIFFFVSFFYVVQALRMLSFDKEQTLGTLKGQECTQAPPYESEEAALRRRGPQQTLQTSSDARGYESTGNAPSDVRVGNMSSFDSEQTLGTLKGQESTNAPPLEEEEEKMRRSGPQLDMQSRSSARGYESTGNAPRNLK
ncbi:hypothetical protein HDU85_005346 [Gaertneriomyces sp. JEL0708]|nr:hypothetical protein HDU85_005346 [Gaertneriomyces sp. JEL0708]